MKKSSENKLQLEWKNIMYGIFKKIKKLKNYPNNRKSKKEWSSELMLKTKNVHTHYISKDKFSKNSKTQKLPPKTLQNQKSKKECSNELMLKKWSDTLD